MSHGGKRLSIRILNPLEHAVRDWETIKSIKNINANDSLALAA